VIKRDRRKLILFSPLTSEKGKSLLLNACTVEAGSDTVVFISEGNCFIKSTAILKLLKVIGGGWKLFYAFIIVPAFIREFIYDIIARNRHRIFGRSQACIIPSPETEQRFLI
jgi:predicted DCC family thiol-disulfide oxidoreductase YuxK